MKKDAEALEKVADYLAAKAEHKHAENCEAEAGWHSGIWAAAGKYPAAVQGQLIHQQPLSFLYILYIVQW